MSNSDQDGIPELPCLVAGEEMGGELLDVHYPYNGELAGRVRMVDGEGLECALNRARQVKMSRWERHEVLMKAREILSGRAEEFANLIRSESGLCMRETRYEVGRTRDVLQFAAWRPCVMMDRCSHVTYLRRGKRVRFLPCVNP